MQLRWLVTKYPYPTMGEIRAFAEQNACTLQSARNSLVKRDKTELQILEVVTTGTEWVDAGYGTSKRLVDVTEERWVTIPTVVVEAGSEPT